MPKILCLFIIVFILAVSGWGATEEDSEIISNGFNQIRIENEYKLSFPSEKAEVIWDFFKKRYENNETFFLKQWDSGFSSEYSEEYFIDQYFDTSDFLLLKNENSVRRRMRVIPSDPTNKKNGRSLIQIKLRRAGENETNRSEIKFPVDKEYTSILRNDMNPVLMIKGLDRQRDFVGRLSELRIDHGRLRHVFTLEQKRRRIYISLNAGPFATITLDEITSNKWWVSLFFTEVEIELSEIAYTDSDSKKREQMQKINDLIKNDLTNEFDFVKIDQEPKYNKVYRMFTVQIPWFQYIFRIFSFLNG